MTLMTRRTFTKVAAGMVAFIPAALNLGKMQNVLADGCSCQFYQECEQAQRLYACSTCVPNNPNDPCSVCTGGPYCVTCTYIGYC